MSKEGNQETKFEPLSVSLTHQVSGHKWEIQFIPTGRDLGTHLLTHTAVLKQRFSSLEDREIKRSGKYVAVEVEHLENFCWSQNVEINKFLQTLPSCCLLIELHRSRSATGKGKTNQGGI